MANDIVTLGQRPIRLVHYTDTPRLGLLRRLKLWQTFGMARQQHITMKPEGFWVSDENADMGWKEWCVGQGFRTNRLTCVHDVTLAADARIVYLRNEQDILGFTEAFAVKDHLNNMLAKGGYRPPDHGDYYDGNGMFMDWPKVAQLYQGIVITPYIWRCRMAMNTFWYYPWDCASGCIWDVSAIQDITLRKQTTKQKKVA